MAQYMITVDSSQDAALLQVAAATGRSAEDVLSKAVARGMTDLAPEVLGPMAALRELGYPNVEGPMIDQTVMPDMETLRPALPLTRSNLLALQARGVTLVNITFTRRGLEEQADLPVKQLLATPPFP